jgi:hypothetical protein
MAKLGETDYSNMLDKILHAAKKRLNIQKQLQIKNKLIDINS